MNIIKRIGCVAVAVLLAVGASVESKAEPIRAAPVDRFDQIRFWDMIDVLGRAIEGGRPQLLASWPGLRLKPAHQNEFIEVIDGGSFSVGERLVVAKSEMRFVEGGRVGIVLLELEGGCMTRNDVKHHFPNAAKRAYPQPDNPNPHSYLMVQEKGLKAAFGFPDRNPDCLRTVTFNPGTLLRSE